MFIQGGFLGICDTNHTAVPTLLGERGALGIVTAVVKRRRFFIFSSETQWGFSRTALKTTSGYCRPRNENGLPLEIVEEF